MAGEVGPGGAAYDAAGRCAFIWPAAHVSQSLVVENGERAPLQDRTSGFPAVSHMLMSLRFVRCHLPVGRASSLLPEGSNPDLFVTEPCRRARGRIRSPCSPFLGGLFLSAHRGECRDTGAVDNWCRQHYRLCIWLTSWTKKRSSSSGDSAVPHV